jgi:thiamine biosynthesis lipoprotein
MGMPITVEIVDPGATEADLECVFAYFDSVDCRFSTYKPDSEISRINRRELEVEAASADMKTVLALAEQTRDETNGYFQIARPGMIDPSGLVKGWAIQNAAELLHENGFRNYIVDAGGDVQVAGKNAWGKEWRVGIRNPFDLKEIVKVLALTDRGVATSGTYVRGQHIYDPYNVDEPITGILSLTVVGPNVYDADRFATAAFAMGRDGILFIEGLEGFEGYMIDEDHRATYTSGFERYVEHAEDH